MLNDKITEETGKRLNPGSIYSVFKLLKGSVNASPPLPPTLLWSINANFSHLLLIRTKITYEHLYSYDSRQLLTSVDVLENYLQRLWMLFHYQLDKLCLSDDPHINSTLNYAPHLYLKSRLFNVDLDSIIWSIGNQ